MSDPAKTGAESSTNMELTIELEIEELEEIVAPLVSGKSLNHNETFVGDEETELEA